MFDNTKKSSIYNWICFSMWTSICCLKLSLMQDTEKFTTLHYYVIPEKVQVCQYQVGDLQCLQHVDCWRLNVLAENLPNNRNITCKLFHIQPSWQCWMINEMQRNDSENWGKLAKQLKCWNPDHLNDNHFQTSLTIK